jgi:hypothetical protein
MMPYPLTSSALRLAMSSRTYTGLRGALAGLPVDREEPVRVAIAERP